MKFDRKKANESEIAKQNQLKKMIPNKKIKIKIIGIKFNILFKIKNNYNKKKEIISEEPTN
jgi:hypothetical protein